MEINQQIIQLLQLASIQTHTDKSSHEKKQILLKIGVEVRRYCLQPLMEDVRGKPDE